MNPEPNLKEVVDSFLVEQSKDPPPMLWHYTNTRGMLGILSSGKLWATHTQFLNDASEMLYAHAVLAGSIGCAFYSWKYFTKDRLSDRFLNELGKTIGKYLPICVISFSETKNELSQWRAYGGESGSFSLGFTPDLLQKYSKLQKTTKFNLYRCIYDESEQLRLCERFVSASLNAFFESRRVEEDAENSIPRICEEASHCFMMFAPLIKHRDFKQEAEWRLVSDGLELAKKPFHFREGKTCAVPYIEFTLTEDSLENPASQSGMNPVHLLIGPPQVYSLRDLPDESLASCADFKLTPQIERSLTPHRKV